MLDAKYGWDVAFPEAVPDHLIFEHILKNRGIDDVDRFFTMGKESLCDPFLLEDMEKAVNRVIRAIAAQEKILIYGDYDCDGISAIAVLYRTLQRLGANVSYDLPDRFSDGYGLNMRAVEDFIRDGVRLVITVDNGITCSEEVARLAQAGIDTIVTDHHEVMGEPPNAYAILHAKLSKTYPFKDLAGVGMSFKLALALSGDSLDDLTDLVMIGTIADLVPLHGENQAIVNLGLEQLKRTVHPGLKKLLQYSHLDQINVTAVAFKIAPKINSSGRMGKAKDAVRLLVSDSEEEVNRLILDIEANHAERKDLTDEAYALCETMVDDRNHVLVLASPAFHEGVIGLCAQKIAEKYQKSTVVICTGDDQVGKGSMRSYGDDDILGFLNQSADLLVRYGGHSQAAGLAIDIAKIPDFQERLNRLSVQQVLPKLAVDMEIRISEISMDTIRKLEYYSFFTAKFRIRDLRILSKTIMTGKHTKFVLTDGKKTVEAIAFNNLEYFYRLEEGDVIDLVGGLSINTWRNRETLQIMIKDVSCGHFQVLDLRSEEGYLAAAPGLRRAPHALILDDQIRLEEFNLPALMKKISPATVAVGPSARGPLIEHLLNKEGIGSVYRLIQRGPATTLRHLAQTSKNPEWVLEPVLRIFEELNLIAIHEGTVRVLDVSEKRNLADSPMFNALMDARQQLAFLNNESLIKIKSYFTNLMEA